MRKDYKDSALHIIVFSVKRCHDTIEKHTDEYRINEEIQAEAPKQKIYLGSESFRHATTNGSDIIVLTLTGFFLPGFVFVLDSIVLGQVGTVLAKNLGVRPGALFWVRCGVIVFYIAIEVLVSFLASSHSTTDTGTESKKWFKALSWGLAFLPGILYVVTRMTVIQEMAATMPNGDQYTTSQMLFTFILAALSIFVHILALKLLPLCVRCYDYFFIYKPKKSQLEKEERNSQNRNAALRHALLGEYVQYDDLSQKYADVRDKHAEAPSVNIELSQKARTLRLELQGIIEEDK